MSCVWGLSGLALIRFLSTRLDTSPANESENQ
jgi:hypothetical protein